jgi:dipeptidyl aminopeptidase/acylaminoacyl peptidase
MRTPLLLIHNEMDLRCPIEQAEQLFVQLRRIGKCVVEMVRFPEESQNLSRSGRPAAASSASSASTAGSTSTSRSHFEFRKSAR